MENLEKEVNSILEKHKKGDLTTDNARRLLLLFTGHAKTAACKLDRIQNECSIYLYTTGKCENCGNKC
jgi:hypothetical protein